ncbi:hypothetical protein KEM52_006156 [Ascosphaera acerosa]|nr:hypothetical protein KEM52_006156 [Ascosphaera acerosa]
MACSLLSLFTEFRDVGSLRERIHAFEPDLVLAIHQTKDRYRKAKASEYAKLPLDAASLASLLPPRPLVEKIVTAYFLYVSSDLAPCVNAALIRQVTQAQENE